MSSSGGLGGMAMQLLLHFLHSVRILGVMSWGGACTGSTTAAQSSTQGMQFAWHGPTGRLHKLPVYCACRWDMTFWAERLREARYDLNEEELRPYFALPTVSVSKGVAHMSYDEFGAQHFVLKKVKVLPKHCTFISLPIGQDPCEPYAS